MLLEDTPAARVPPLAAESSKSSLRVPLFSNSHPCSVSCSSGAGAVISLSISKSSENLSASFPFVAVLCRCCSVTSHKSFSPSQPTCSLLDLKQVHRPFAVLLMPSLWRQQRTLLGRKPLLGTPSPHLYLSALVGRVIQVQMVCRMCTEQDLAWCLAHIRLGWIEH